MDIERKTGKRPRCANTTSMDPNAITYFLNCGNSNQRMHGKRSLEARWNHGKEKQLHPFWDCDFMEFDSSCFHSFSDLFISFWSLSMVSVWMLVVEIMMMRKFAFIGASQWWFAVYFSFMLSLFVKHLFLSSPNIVVIPAKIVPMY